jgi:hypothetical protein
MAVLPATGTTISMGRVQQSYNNVTAGTGPNATAGSINVRLNASLGVSYGGKAANAQTQFSSTFGGKTTPYTY